MSPSLVLDLIKMLLKDVCLLEIDVFNEMAIAGGGGGGHSSLQCVQMHY